MKSIDSQNEIAGSKRKLQLQEAANMFLMHGKAISSLMSWRQYFTDIGDQSKTVGDTLVNLISLKSHYPCPLEDYIICKGLEVCTKTGILWSVSCFSRSVAVAVIGQ